MYSPRACAFEDFDVLSFERVKWGGVRHSSFSYACFDLWRFSHTVLPDPTPEDVAIFRSLISAIRGAHPSDTAPRLARKMKGVFPSAQAERVQLLDILGHCGILRDTNREFPSRSDMSSVAGYWRGADGLDEHRLHAYFGEWV